ncbi:DNA-protecting protein DprA [Patescibacteria group bacterium]|nr:MAG: DNA-protecting protein DprA [Patescibacteria group bacterium]
MSYTIRELKNSEFPPLLKEIPDPPKKLFCAGTLPPAENKILCVVGSRKGSDYGREVCEQMIAGLRGFPITIVSGLALGIDSLAHRAALESGLQNIAIPGSGLDPKVLYPSSHIHLAEEIIEKGGALLSEFENDFRAAPWSFPQRNRIMAGMSHAAFIVEAEARSGTLITARLAADYNRDVLTVPGSIFSPNSEGPNMLIKLGAVPVTSPEDILKTLGFEVVERRKLYDSYENLSPEEKKIVGLLTNPMSRDELIRALNVPASQVNMILSAMEIKGLIAESMGEIRLN